MVTEGNQGNQISQNPMDNRQSIDESLLKPIIPDSTHPMDLETFKTESGALMKLLGWDVVKGKAYLLEKYGVQSRNQLEDEQAIEFLNHLKKLASEKYRLSDPWAA